MKIKGLISKLVKSVVGRLKPAYIWLRLLNRLYRSTNYYKRPEFVIGSGTLGRAEFTYSTACKNFLSIPSVDMTWEHTPNLLERKYCVYVDESVCYSPDKLLYGMSAATCTDIDAYSANICGVFKKIEETLGCEVVIAASGKYRYPPESKIFGGRKLIYDNTNNLIKHSELVLGHSSSGLWQALVDVKPMILLTDPTFSSAKWQSIGVMASFLGLKSPSTLDITPEQIKLAMEVDVSNYVRLVELYFKERDVSGSSGELIVGKLDTIF